MGMRTRIRARGGGEVKSFPGRRRPKEERPKPKYKEVNLDTNTYRLALQSHCDTWNKLG